MRWPQGQGDSADTGGNPGVAKTKAQEMIERGGVNVIPGPLAAFELLAIIDYVRASALHTVSLTDTPRECVPLRPPRPVFIRRCEKKDGKLVNTVIKAYPELSQF